MIKLVITADDLTGANDSAVQFAAQGMKTVATVPGSDYESIKDAEVLVADTESRDIKRDQAYNEVKSTLERIYAKNSSALVYKKMDSTMRGNIGAELQAAYDAVKPSLIICAPAYIPSGRTTVDGKQLLNGRLLETTELANIPKSPVSKSDIESIIHDESELKCAHIYLKDYESGLEHLHSMLRGFVSDKVKIVIADAISQEQQDMLAVAALDFEKVIFAGSAGLALSLAKQLSSGQRQLTSAEVECSRVLVLSGSISEITRKQTHMLVDKRNSSLVRADSILTVDDPEKSAAITSQQVKRLALGSAIVTVSVAYGQKDVEISGQHGKEIGLSFFEVGERTAKFMAEVMRLCAEDFDGFIITGGDTAIHACSAVNAGCLEVLCEVEKGIPMSRIVSGPLKGKFLVTKAGAFGTDSAFVTAADRLLGL
ncbi:MAG: four-carbon acid sugar kinase family protein [Succinivibrio sp.]|nr:four-carbon acid sugar kinase family protein [Succinivibrio sp.]